MTLLSNRAVVALVGWTLLIWATRISNVWRDDDLGTGSKLGNTALALSFVALALVVVWSAWRGAPTTARRAVAVLGGWTVGVWLIRSVDILVGDWSVGFKVVHTGLAVVSVGLALAAARSIRSPERQQPVLAGDR